MVSLHCATLDRIRMATGAAKQVILFRNAEETLSKILRFTYDPRKHYYINQVPWKGRGQNWIDRDGFEILDQLSKRILSGTHAKITVQCYMQELRPEEAEIFKGILKKDLRIGMATKTINKALPGLIDEFGVMLASTFKKNMWQPSLFASIKLDGLRAYWDGQTMYTRNGFEITGVDHIIKKLPNFPLDGELLIPGDHFQKSSGKIRSFNVTPDAVYFIFDQPSDLPFFERYQDMLQLVEDYGWGTRLATPQPVNILLHKRYPTYEELDAMFGKALMAGYEGLVLKNPKAAYQLKRSKDWLKIKAVKSEDLPIVGFFEGEGKYEGSLGGVIVQRKNGKEVKVGSGFSDDYRTEIWSNQHLYVGKLIEVHYHEVTPDGSLRHPRFKGFRLDK